MRRWPLLFVIAALTTAVPLRGQVTAAKPLAFDVATIKPVGEVDPRVLASLGGGCDGGAPRVDHKRFSVTTTAYALMTWAYGFNKNGGCSFVSYGGFVVGGPDWVRSERFAIQALAPDGAPEYTFGEFMNGHAPQLEVMIKTLLAERFHLTMHGEMKEVQGYTLVVGKNGPKIRRLTERDAASVPPPQRAGTTAGARRVYMRTNMTYVALALGVITHRPVIDQTGLTGEFIFDLEYAPDDALPGESSAGSVFTAVQEQLGLKLESAKVPAEVIVIDRIERPTPD
jgi:uncharacterized protein (TIGR03435 family)